MAEDSLAPPRLHHVPTVVSGTPTATTVDALDTGPGTVAHLRASRRRADMVDELVAEVAAIQTTVPPQPT